MFCARGPQSWAQLEVKRGVGRMNRSNRRSWSRMGGEEHGERDIGRIERDARGGREEMDINSKESYLI